MVPPHPAASNPVARRITGREGLCAERRMVVLPRRVWPTAGASVEGDRIAIARARTARPPGRVMRRLPGWADSAYDTIVTVRHRAWGQFRRFGRAAFRCCILRPRCDHGEQHSRDGSQREGDSRRQVQANSSRSTRKRRPGTPPGSTNSRQRHRKSIRLAGALLRPGGALPAASAGAPGFPGCPRDHAGHSPGPGSFAGKVTLTSYGTGSSAPNPSHGAGGCGTSAAELRDFAALP
jgi:hypothetical protein